MGTGRICSGPMGREEQGLLEAGNCKTHLLNACTVYSAEHDYKAG